MKRAPVILLAALLLLCASAVRAGEHITTAILPAVVPKELPERFHPGEYLVDRMIVGMNKVERFKVLAGGDVDRMLEEHLLKAADVKPEKAAEIAKALNVRLLVFPRIDALKSEIVEEDRVLIKVRNAVCTATVSAILYDAATAKSTPLGPYPAEERKVASQDPLGRAILTPDAVEKMLKQAIDQAAVKVRGRVYVLYPLVGRITASNDTSVTIDIGTDMGVAAGHLYAVTATVERENAITGLMEKVTEQVSVLEVKSVTKDSGKCVVASGAKSPPVGSTIQRAFRR